MSLGPLDVGENPLQRPRYPTQIQGTNQNTAIADLAPRSDTREPMELIIEGFASPLRLILELPKLPQLTLLRENPLDRCESERADQFIFEIPRTDEEPESLHIRNRKIRPETSSF
jgi:hypothetical protein